MSIKVLLADSSVSIHKVVELALADQDAELVAVTDGQAALDKAKEIHPNVILAEVDLPEINGFSLCELVKMEPSLTGTRVVILTPSFAGFDEESAKEAGVDDKLEKPFSSFALLEMIKAPPPEAAIEEVPTEEPIFTVGEAPVESEASEEIEAEASAEKTETPVLETAVVNEDISISDLELPVDEPEGEREEVVEPVAETDAEEKAILEEVKASEAETQEDEEAPKEIEAEPLELSETGIEPEPISLDIPAQEPVTEQPPEEEAPEKEPAEVEESEEEPIPLSDVQDETVLELSGEATDLEMSALEEQTSPLETGEGLKLEAGIEPEVLPGEEYIKSEEGEIERLVEVVTNRVLERLGKKDTTEIYQEISAEEGEKLIGEIVKRMSDDVIREVAWEVVPDLAERMIQEAIDEITRS